MPPVNYPGSPDGWNLPQYKETVFFVLHEESGRRIRPRACAKHVGFHARSKPQPCSSKAGPFEVQTHMEERMGSK
jgi:hypothetical protein